jgi:hypothetical protein
MKYGCRKFLEDADVLLIVDVNEDSKDVKDYRQN